MHLLSQPLTVLRGSLELTLLTSRKAADLRACAVEALEQVEEVAGMLSLLREFAATRTETEEPKEVLLGEVVAEITDHLQPLATSRHVGLRVDQAKDFRVHVPRLAFRQALMRLMHAAVSGEPAGGTLRVVSFGGGRHSCMEIRRQSVAHAPLDSHSPLPLHPLVPTLSLARGKQGLEWLVATRALQRLGGKVYTDAPPLQASLCRICLPLAAAVPAERLAPVASGESAPERESSPRVPFAVPVAAEIRGI